MELTDYLKQNKFPKGLNKQTKEKVVQKIEQEMTKVVAEVAEKEHKKGQLSGPIGGMAVMAAIAECCENYKEELKSEKNLIGLSEKEIDELVDKATTNVFNKFLE